MLLSCFFFQAEDGIRDKLVTGVQTCALPICLSTDVETSMTSDLFTIMRTAFTLQRMFINERRFNGEKNLPLWLTCREMLEMATIDGARVAHLDHKIGSLTPGKEADIILLRTDDINVFPLNNGPGAVVTLMDTS